MFLTRLSAAAAVLIVVTAVATGASALAWPAVSRPAAAETRTDEPPLANAGDQTPTPAAQAADRIPKSLTGRVVDGRGRPIPGAEVRMKLFRRSFSTVTASAELVAAWLAHTDVEGQYQIADFHWAQGPGLVYLQADFNAPYFIEFCTFSIWKPAQGDSRKGTLADVQLKRGNNVTGRCIGPDGKAVVGAKIEKIFAKSARSSRGRMPTTDADGRFRLTIPAGVAELIIYSDRWAPQRVAVWPSNFELGDIRLEAGVELIGHLRAPLGDEFLGYVLVQGATGDGLIVKGDTPKGKPLAGKLIALESIDPGRLDREPMNRTPIQLAYRTDREGSFRVPALKGSYKIWVARGAESGPDECMAIHSDGPPPAVLPRVLDFNPDAQGANARVELTLMTSPEVAIRGTVTGLEGKPARGVDLILTAVIGTPINNRPYTVLQWTATDADGRYAFTGVPRGLTRAGVMLLLTPRDLNENSRIVPSQGVTFEPLNKDQDPVDFRLEKMPPQWLAR